MQIDFYMILGIIGMVCILIGFFMIQSHRWTQDDTAYDALNFIGSALLVLYGVVGHAWPFVILNTVWGIYSLKDVIADMERKPVVRKV